MTIKIRFKNPDAICDILNARHPLPDDEADITLKMEQEREDFVDEYFEYGDYGCIEVDPATMTARLLPVREWK
jgi:hypothetical protein